MASDLKGSTYYTVKTITAKNRKFADTALEVDPMNKRALLSSMPDDICTRQHILHAARGIDSTFKETQLRHLLEVLNDSGLIVRVGRNQYKKADNSIKKELYKGEYSPASREVIEFMEDRYPLLDFRIWELSWLNEFINHLIAHNKIFLEIEHEGCEFVFSELIEKYPGKVLLRPTAQEIMRYGVDNGIIIDRLVTEAPKKEGERYQVPLEKLIVDLFANKKLTISKGDYPSAIQQMFATYQVDQVSLFRYARRRNKAKVISDFLKDKTTIELLVEG